MVRKILGFLIAGVGLYITFWGANFGLGVVIIGCTIVLMPTAEKNTLPIGRHEKD